MAMMGANSLALVALSIFVAIFASFTALSLSARLVAAEARVRGRWILAAALALGGGTWSMHFVGMLAMRMPATYDVHLTIVSLVLPIAAAAVGLLVVSRHGAHPAPLLWSGLFVGSGVVAMHYTGMAAMHMRDVTAYYDLRIVALSVVIAIAAATAALWLAFSTRDTFQRAAAATVMGAAISGMHYTGMAAVRFVADGHMPVPSQPEIPPAMLAVAVFCASVLLLVLALATAYFDRKLAALAARDGEALRASERRYRSMIESASDVIGILDCSGAFIYESSSAWHVLGYRSNEIVGRRLTEFVTADGVAEAQRFLDAVLEQPAAPAIGELSLRHKSGGPRDFEIVATNLLYEPAINGIVVNLRDITERKQLLARLETLSETDLLTEALNRRGFTRLAERGFERARRAGEKLAVVMMDIDHFKRVNDRYGHAAGDLVLAKVAESCRRSIAAGDLLGRLGGEEFAMLMTEQEPGAIHALLARIQQAIASATVSTIRGEVAVTASFGLALIDPRSTELRSALGSADEALYEAKHAGRNCIKAAAGAAAQGGRG